MGDRHPSQGGITPPQDENTQGNPALSIPARNKI